MIGNFGAGAARGRQAPPDSGHLPATRASKPRRPPVRRGSLALGGGKVRLAISGRCSATAWSERRSLTCLDAQCFGRAAGARWVRPRRARACGRDGLKRTFAPGTPRRGSDPTHGSFLICASRNRKIRLNGLLYLTRVSSVQKAKPSGVGWGAVIAPSLLRILFIFI